MAGARLDELLSDKVIRSLVFDTFGIRRFTQDAPIRPDVWAEFFRIARESGLEGQAPDGGKLSLILTPKQTMSEDGRPSGHAGQLAERVRQAILGDKNRTGTRDDNHNAARAAIEAAALQPFRIAATTRHVVIESNFRELVRHLLPLCHWWRRQSVQRETEQPSDAYAQFRAALKQGVPIREALVQLNNTELFRFAALLSLLNGLTQGMINMAALGRMLAFLAPLAQDPDSAAGRRGGAGAPTKAARQRQLSKDLDLLESLYFDVVDPVRDGPKSAKTPTTIGDLPTNLQDISIWSIQFNRRVKQQAAVAGQPPTAAPQAPRPAVRRGALSADTVKADAARLLFSVRTAHLAWAVVDTGIDSSHPAFLLDPENSDGSGRHRIVSTLDFTQLQEVLSESLTDFDSFARRALGSRTDLPPGVIEAKAIELRRTMRAIRDENVAGRQIDWALLEPFIKITPSLENRPESPHGTHVAGIIGGYLERGVTGDDRLFEGVCPDIRLFDLRVFGDRHDADDPDRPDQPGGDEFTILAALDYVSWLNRDPMRPAIHGINLSLSIPFLVGSHACGHTPVCEACNRLVWNGTVVVTAAGNSGFENDHREADMGVGFRGMTITDPGNAQYVITVGATHHSEPHTYGVSYFSSRGPTGDGRLKPDLVAPGEKIRSTAPGEQMLILDGTSMAAPHVSGVCALLMGRYSELIGEPERIKEILMATATDLGRERHFQGAGLVDALRALQSV